MTSKEAQAIIKDLADQYPRVFKGVKKDAKTLKKDDFIATNTSKIGPVAMMLGRTLTAEDGKKLLAVGWTMVRKGRI